MKKIKNKKSLVFVLLAISANIILAGAYFYLFSSTLKQKQKNADLQREVATLDKKLSDSKSLKILMDNLNGERVKIDSVFINKENLIKFIEEIESLGGKTGVSLKINSVLIDKTKKSGPRFHLALSGSFSGIFQYLVLLENMPYQIVFKKAYIQLSEKNWRGDFDIILSSFINYEKD